MASAIAPQLGQAYDLTLSPEHSGELCTLRLDFVPASVDREAPGTLHIDAKSHQASRLSCACWRRLNRTR